MTQELLIEIIRFAIKFGLDAAITIAGAAKAKTIDEAIAALEVAKTKSAEDYLAEARANITPTP